MSTWESEAQKERERLIHNERIKLRAAYANTFAGAALAGGFFVPVLAAITPTTVVSTVIIWLMSLCLHHWALSQLTGLR